MNHLTDSAANAMRHLNLYGVTPHKEWSVLKSEGLIDSFGQLTKKGEEWCEADFQRRLAIYNEEVGYTPEG